MPKVVKRSVKATAGTSGVQKKKFKEIKIKIGSQKYITIGPLNGHVLVSIRKYKGARGKEWTNDGVSLHPKEFRQMLAFVKAKLPITLSETFPLVGSSGTVRKELRDGKISIVVGGGGFALTRIQDEGDVGIALKKIHLDTIEKKKATITSAIRECSDFVGVDDDSDDMDEDDSDMSEKEEDDDDE